MPVTDDEIEAIKAEETILSRAEQNTNESLKAIYDAELEKLKKKSICIEAAKCLPPYVQIESNMHLRRKRFNRETH